MSSRNRGSRSGSLLALLMVLTIALSLAACAQPAAPTAAPVAQPTAAPAAAEPTAAPAAEKPAEPTAAPAAAQPAKETEVFKLGILGPFSGPAARTGEEFKGAATMAFDAINWQIGHYKIEPVWIDSQSDPAKSAQAYEQAVVQDGIKAGILNWHSSVAVSCMEITAKYKIPHFYGFGATEVVNEKFNSDREKYGYWMIKGWPSTYLYTKPYVEALEDAIAAGQWTPEKKTAAIYGEDTDLGRSFGAAIKSQLEDEGWTIVAEEFFDIAQTEFYPLLNKLKDLEPALVAGTSTAPPSLSAFIKQADEVGLKSIIIADGLGWVGEWYDLTGSSSNYVLDQIPGWATEKSKKFAEDFKARWNLDPSPSAAGLAYDGTNFFIKMAQELYAKEGELTSQNIYQFVKENIWTGKWTYKDGIVMTEYKYTDETIPDMVVGKGYYLFPVRQYMDGVGYIVYPPEWAEQKLTGKQ